MGAPSSRKEREFVKSSCWSSTTPTPTATMCDDEESAALVIDNGSGMVKCGFAGDDYMEVMVDADTVDTVERDLLMPGTEVDTEDMVDTEDTDTVDMLTESKFYTSINLLPFILIS